MVFASCLNSSFALRPATTLPSSLDPAQFEFFWVLSGFGFILLSFVWLWFFFFDVLSGWQNLVADFAACKFWHLCHISYKFGLIRHFRFGLSLCCAFGNVFTECFRIPFLSNGLVSRQTDKNIQSSDNLPKHTPHFITNKQTRHFL